MEFKTKEKEELLTKSITLTKKHFEILEGITKETGLNRSEIVRQLIDNYERKRVERQKDKDRVFY